MRIVEPARMSAPSWRFASKHHGPQRLLVTQPRLQIATHGHRLEVLRAHHRAHARAGCRPVFVVDDGRDKRQVLARWTDTGHVGIIGATRPG